MGVKVESFPTRVKPQIIPMADAQVKLVWGYTGAAGEKGLKSNILFVDAESGGTEDLLLPPENKSAGMWIFIANTGGESVVVKEDSDTTTIVTIGAGSATIVACDGTSWHDMMPTSNTVDFGVPGLQTDLIAESTAAAGVTIDGLVIKDATIKPSAGGSAFIDLTAVATGEADISLKDNLASALEIREAATAYLTFVTTNSSEAIVFGKPLKSTVGMSAVLDVSAGATGESDVIIADNLASAFEFRESATPYLTFCTTNSSEAIVFGKPLKSTVGMSSVLDVSAGATGESDIVIADNLASALEVRQSTNSYLTFVTTNDAERISAGKLIAVASQVIDMADVQVALVYGTAGAGEVKLTGQVLFVDANSSGTEDLLLPPEATSAGVALDIFNTGGESIVVKEDSDTTTIVTIPTAKSARVACNGTTWYAILGA